MFILQVNFTNAFPFVFTYEIFFPEQKLVSKIKKLLQNNPDQSSYHFCSAMSVILTTATLQFLSAAYPARASFKDF